MAIRTILLAATALALCPAPAWAQDAAPTWTEIGALFADRCTSCHAGDRPSAGLRLDTYENALAGSGNGPVLISGDTDASELVKRLRGESQPRMPLGGTPLSPGEIAQIEAWVRAGLPQGAAPSPPAPAAEAPAAPPAAAPAEPAPAAPPPAAGPAEGTITFATVEPIFLKHCAGCHSSEVPSPPEGLRLDLYQNILAGGERVVVIPFRPELSEIVRRIEGKAMPAMPLDMPPLAPDEIAAISAWIAAGAPDLMGNPAPIPAGGEIRFRGILTERWAIDGAPFTIEGARIDAAPQPGDEAEMRGIVQPDGSILATRLRRR